MARRASAMYLFMLLASIMFAAMFACQHCPETFARYSDLQRHLSHENGECRLFNGPRLDGGAADGDQRRMQNPRHAAMDGHEFRIDEDDDEMEYLRSPTSPEQPRGAPSSLDSTYILGRWAHLACNGAGIPAADLQSLLSILHDPEFDITKASILPMSRCNCPCMPSHPCMLPSHVYLSVCKLSH